MGTPSTPRTDLPFLRRRVRAEQPATPAQAPTPVAPAQSAHGLNLSRPQPVSPTHALGGMSHTAPTLAAPAQPRTPAQPQRPAGLVLGGSTPTSSASPRAQKLAAQREKATREDHEVRLLFPAPGIEELYELNFVTRVLRLSPLQSAVGSMVVSGSTAIAWESVRRVTGGQTVDGHKAGTAVMTEGNRELVGYHGRDALLVLRHVREFRRAIFINRSSSAMGVRLHSGESVALPPAAGGTQMVLLAHRIGNVLELRAEPVPHDWSDLQIWQEFDFSMTHKAPTSAYGR